MSAVYEAKDLLIGRHVALKILHPHVAGNAEVVRRFRREAEAMARIQHPNVVMVHEMGQRRDGSFFIIQELLTGENLRAHLDERGQLSVDEAIDITLPMMGALVAAHSHGVIHRDVKPENIVLTRSASGEIIPKLVDFGIAKLHTVTGNSLTDVGSLLGTVQYMSPEQASGVHAVDARSDVWAVAVVLFELCAGRCPFDGPSIQTVLARLMTQPAPRLDAVVAGSPKELADIVERALEPDLSRRFSSMQAFRDALLAFAGGRPRQPAGGRSMIVDSDALADATTEQGGAPLAIQDTMPVSDEVTSPREIEVPRSRPAPMPPPRIMAADVGGEWLDPDDLISLDENPSSRDGGALFSPKIVLHPRKESPRQSSDWSIDRPSTPYGLENEHAAAADLALRVNNLAEAIEHAEDALRMAPQDESLAGRMWLVKANAHRWLGDYIEAERCAREATARLPRGSRSWYAALGYVVIASGYLGRRDPLESILAEITRAEPNPAKADVHTILLCRLAIFLVRTGAPDVAQSIVSELWMSQDISAEPVLSDAIVQAWLDVARAEIATHQGDVATYLRRIESAVDNFTAAGDLRDACLQRANIGNAYMQLGAHRRAVAVFKELLDVAEPMQLGFVGHVKANLGFALAHLNQLDEALFTEQEALDHCQRQNLRRSEGVAWLYLATIHFMRDELEEAALAAEHAIAVDGAGPTVRAHGLAMLARMLLEQQEPALALDRAEEAMSLLERLGGVEEGESLIRWVHALALRNSGQEPEGRRRIAEARRRLLERANRINEPHWRESFLQGVRDNERLLRLASQWLGD